MQAMTRRAKLRERAYHTSKYPRCWKRVSLAIRRLANGVCQRCGQASNCLEVHHLGAPYANGRPGNSYDKHDIRQENLAAICLSCHNELDQVLLIRSKKRDRKKRRTARIAAHRASMAGTGLVPPAPARHAMTEPEVCLLLIQATGGLGVLVAQLATRESREASAAMTHLTRLRALQEASCKIS